MEPLLAAKDLSFKEFLRYPNIGIEEGVVTFISGASGCGKSTLLKLLNGTITPSTGRVEYRGQDIFRLDMIGLRRKVLLVKQIPFLFRGSILQNFMAYHQFHESDCPSRSEIADYLNLCCIPASLETSCDTMSGGERQRIFLSIAVSLMPEVLLLDEPASALNRDLSNQVLDHIVKYSKHQNTTLVIVNHDPDLQGAFAEKIIECNSSDGGKHGAEHEPSRILQ